MMRRMKTQTTSSRAFAFILTVLLVLNSMGISGWLTAEAKDTTYTVDGLGLTSANATFLEFSDTGITASGVSTGYSISGTALTITASGDYVLSGSCASGYIKVNKDLGEDVNLILNGLTLTNTTSGKNVIEVKGGDTDATKATITLLKGTTNTLTDATTTSAVISTKKKLTIEGTGTLVVNATSTATDTDGDTGNTGIKSDTSIEIKKNANVTVNATKHGISADKELKINGGSSVITVNASSDALRSNPDADDEDFIAGEGGIVTIKGGTINLTAGDEGIQADRALNISGGTITVVSASDCLKSDAYYTASAEASAESASGSTSTTASSDANKVYVGDVSITGGTLNLTSTAGDGISAYNSVTVTEADATVSITIKTKDGYNTRLASSDDGSYKGIKAGTTVTLSAGTYDINTADDAIHSNGYVYIYGGTYEISTGDDGAHADTSLVVGQEGADNSALTLNINNSYEGLEGGTVYIYSGVINVTSSDDGVNAAGGSDSTSTNTNDNFNRGGGFGGGPGGGMSAPGSQGSSTGNASSSSTDYAIYVNGGVLTVNATGDGLDSNGSLTISGGTVVVWGESSGANNALDCETTLTISGGTVFAAGANNNMVVTPASTSQTYVMYSGTTVSSGKYLQIVDASGDIVYQVQAVKSVDSIIYSASGLSGSYTLTTSDTELDPTSTVSVTKGTTVSVSGTSSGSNGGNSGNSGDSGNNQPGGTTPSGNGTPQMPSGNGTPQVPSGNGAPQMPSGEGTPQMPSGNGAPQMPSGNGAPQMPSGNANPQMPSGNGTASGDSNGLNTGSGDANASGDGSGEAIEGDSDSNVGSTGTKALAKGKTFYVGKNKYKVINTKKKQVQFVSTKSKAKKLTIPATVTYKNVKYKVVSIGNKAFAGNRKVTKITLGKNVVKIGKAAFKNCKKLKKIVIKSTKLKASGLNKKAFKGVKKKVVIDVPNSKITKYKKLFRKKGLLKSVKIK